MKPLVDSSESGALASMKEHFTDAHTTKVMHQKHCGRVAGKFKHRLDETDADGRNVLHHLAASKPSLDTIAVNMFEVETNKVHSGVSMWEWVKKTFDSDFDVCENLLLARDNSGVMPVTIAIAAAEDRKEWWPLVNMIMYKVAWRPDRKDLFDEVVAAAAPGPKKFLTELRNRRRFQDFWEKFGLESRSYSRKDVSDFDLDKAKEEAENLDWCPKTNDDDDDDNSDWAPNGAMQWDLHLLLRKACTTGHVELVKWLIDVWQAPVDPPITPGNPDDKDEYYAMDLKYDESKGQFAPSGFDSSISLTDCAVLMSSTNLLWARSYEVLIPNDDSECVFGVPKYTLDRKREEKEQRKNDGTWEDHGYHSVQRPLDFLDTFLPVEVFGSGHMESGWQPAKVPFNEFVKEKWEKIKEEKEYSFSGACEYEKSFWKARAIKCEQPRSDERLELIKFFVDRYGSRFLPRLDFVIMCDSVPILKWMIDNGNVKFTDQLHWHSHLEGERFHRDTAEEADNATENNEDVDEEFMCAYCFDDYRKNDPFRLRCGHTFCSACLRDELRVNHLEDNQMRYDARPWANARCAMCRADVSGDIPHTIGLMGRFLTDLEYNTNPAFVDWFLMDTRKASSATVADALFMASIGVGAINTLEFLSAQDSVDFRAETIGGHNAMRIATSLSQFFSIKWLASKGLSDLALELSHEYLDADSPEIFGGEDGDVLQLSSVHEACRNGVLFTYNCFEKMNYMSTADEFLDSAGATYISHLRANIVDSRLSEIARDWHRDRVAVKLPKLIANQSSLAHIKEYLLQGQFTEPMKRIPLWDGGTNSDATSEYLFECFILIFKHQREDVLRWLHLNQFSSYDRHHVKVFGSNRFGKFGNYLPFQNSYFLGDRDEPIPEFVAAMRRHGTTEQGYDPRLLIPREKLAGKHSSLKIFELMDTIDTARRVSSELNAIRNKVRDLFCDQKDAIDLDKLAPCPTIDELVALRKEHDDLLSSTLTTLDPDFHRFLTEEKWHDKASHLRGHWKLGHYRMATEDEDTFSRAVLTQNYEVAEWIGANMFEPEQLKASLHKMQQECITASYPLEIFKWLWDYANRQGWNPEPWIQNIAAVSEHPPLIFAAGRELARTVYFSSENKSHEKRSEIATHEKSAQFEIFNWLLEQRNMRALIKSARVGTSKKSFMWYVFNNNHGMSLGMPVAKLPEHLQFDNMFKFFVEECGADATLSHQGESLVDAMGERIASYWDRDDVLPCIKVVRYLVDYQGADISHWSQKKRDELRPSTEERRELSLKAIEARSRMGERRERAATAADSRRMAHDVASTIVHGVLDKSNNSLSR